MVANVIIRRQARALGVPLWQIAKHLGISEATMTRRLRSELSENEKAEILEIISSLANLNDGDGACDGKEEIQS